MAAISGLDGKLRFPASMKPCEVRLAHSKQGGGGGGGGGPPAPAPKSSNWQTFYTPEGHAYYYNSITQQTQWEKPAELDQPMGGGPRFPSNSMGGGGGPGGNQPQQEFGPPGSNLFIFHLPPEWNDMDLIQHFQHFGSIVSARVQKSNEGGGNRNRGFGFVSFDNTTSAAQAIRAMNGFSVGGKWLKVQLKKGEEHLTPADIVSVQNTRGPAQGGQGGPRPMGGQAGGAGGPMGFPMQGGGPMAGGPQMGGMGPGMMGQPGPMGGMGAPQMAPQMNGTGPGAPPQGAFNGTAAGPGYPQMTAAGAQPGAYRAM
uniref:RRM domain-containing protein n=1 Tax=Chromera velia CCMP2878 TaxID=1169474 RepID=A0A0G4GYL8_9ALVE|eukprot:Cvel_5394.t1-p1 / transcript=Cvel_5394.t1 / gene=Cvel_5394 / organism=Chromera_velia_CCMP2878 / gene_product=CUGBP Elav-like family member 6, putative / transcript_product=CUGBP Elav-like family member 6, putative / location=Cvel_scaffold251:24500-25435(+) / protein_length=312 / sequence_SO=supercontig / SO=protein_coding / is_pseudo=false